MDTDLRNFLANHSLEGVVVADMEGNILQCNGTAHRILGYQDPDLDGQFIGYIFPAPSVSHLLPNLLHLARAEGGFEGDIILQDSIGDSVMVRMNAQAWPEADPTRLLLRFLDWRETHQIMTQLRESNQMASLGTLTRSLSHEILNPVSIIGGHTRRLLDSLKPDSKEEEWARQVIAGVEKLESMIETIQTFLNLPSPSFQKRSLDDLLYGSLERIREDAERSGIRIIKERGKKPPQIYMDPDLLEKVFSAVLLNAVDRMPKGGELTLGLSYGEGHCRISVEDSGPALDARQMEEDLSPIHIIGAHRTHLNLAIAKRIVDEHGGRFDIDGSASGGLKVKIRLPGDRRALAREREM
jgi:two-component system sensor histidine kinase HydH